jgi:hypothetical protein
VYVKDLDRRGGKLGKQCWIGHLVGYMGHRGYRVWDPARKRVFEVRDVQFDEGIGRLQQARIEEEMSTPPVPQLLISENDNQIKQIEHNHTSTNLETPPLPPDHPVADTTMK